MKTLFKTTAIVLATAGAVLAPAAFASTSDDITVTIDSRYLTTDWGVEKVYTTLTNKAESACDAGHVRDIAARRFARDCMSDLLDDFIANVDDEKLTVYHANMTS